MREFILKAVVIIMAAFLTGDAFALTLEEAVDLALDNNHRIRQFEFLERSAGQNVGTARGAFYPSLDLGYSYTESNEDIFFTTNTSSTFTVQASYNLFNGLADYEGLREAQSRSLASRYQKQSVVADVVLSAKTAFAEVLRARHAGETARESVELLERQRRDAALFYREGLIAKNELLKVEVELASARQELLQAEGNRRIALRRLERTMGTELAPDEAVEELGAPPEAPALAFDALKEEMVGKRSELRYLRAVAEAYRHEKLSVRGGYLPRVDLVLSYNRYLKDGATFLSEFDSDTRGVVTAQWNLFGGFRTLHGMNALRYQEWAAKAQARDTEEELLFQLREALEGHAVAEGKLRVAETAVSQAEENYRVTESQFRERVATSTDLLDARSFLTRARNQHVNALYDVHVALARIERVLERGEWVVP